MIHNVVSISIGTSLNVFDVKPQFFFGGTSADATAIKVTEWSFPFSEWLEIQSIELSVSEMQRPCLAKIIQFWPVDFTIASSFL